MGDTLKKVTKEERRKEFRRRVIGDFIKYYNFLTDEEAFAVQKIVIDAKNRFIGEEEYGCEDRHRDA